MKSQVTNHVLLEGKFRKGLYAFDNIALKSSLFSSTQCNKNMSCNVAQSCNNEAVAKSVGDVHSLWHARLGHAYTKTVSKVLKICNISSNCNKIPSVCKGCCMGRSHKLSFVYSTTVYDQPLQLIYSDIWGPSPISSNNGSRYCIHFIDTYSKFTWLYLIPNKSQAL